MRRGIYAGRLTFGKHLGVPLSEVPLGYLGWLWDDGVAEEMELVEPLKAEFRRRLALDTPPAPPAPFVVNGVRAPVGLALARVEELVAAGRRTLARQYHPDLGGDTAAMQDVNLAAEWLDTLLRSLERQARY